MRMTIDEYIKGLEYLKECGVCPFTDKTGKIYTDEYLDGAIDIMHKYQQIRQIYMTHHYTDEDVIEKIKEVIKFG